MTLEFTSRRKEKTEETCFFIRLELFKPTKKNYPLFNFDDLQKKQLGENWSDKEDPEIKEIVARLESKYGEMSKKKRKLMIELEDTVDGRARYRNDLKDDFIDDSQANDEWIPPNFDTAEAGYYVNKGKLELVPVDEECYISEGDEELLLKCHKKRTQSLYGNENLKKRQIIWLPNQENAMSNNSMFEKLKTINKKRAGGENAKKKVESSLIREVSEKTSILRQSPGYLSKNSPLQSLPKKRTLCQSGEEIKKKKINRISLSTVEHPDVPVATMKHSLTPIELMDDCLTSSTVLPMTSDNLTSIIPNLTETPMTPTEKSIKQLPNISFELQDKIKYFETVTMDHTLVGKKKFLQNHHIDLLLDIEEQIKTDGLSVHEKIKIFQNLADYVRLKYDSLYRRCYRRRQDLKKKNNVLRKKENEFSPRQISSDECEEAAVVSDSSKITITAR